MRPLLAVVLAVPLLLSAPAALIAADDPPSADPPAELPDHTRLLSPADGLWVVCLDDHEAKAVLAEFETFLALVESPGDEAAARRIMALARDRWPRKPIRFVFHTHHHGHSLATVDPFLAAGIQIVTSSGNLDRMAGHALDEARFRSSALVVSDRFTLEDPSNRLTMLVIPEDEYDVPVDDYVIVHFPEQRVLVTGCLYNKPVAYHEVINVRKPALRRFIADNDLDAETLIPTNTTGADGYFEDVCTLAMLDETLEKGMNPARVYERLARRSVEELRADLDGLTAEFSDPNLRPFDLLVTGNTMRLTHEDPARAAVFLEMTERRFPDDDRVPYYLGLALWQSGDRAGADRAWERTVAKAENEEDRAYWQEAIAEARQEESGGGS
jgi:hypothetical protein